MKKPKTNSSFKIKVYFILSILFFLLFATTAFSQKTDEDILIDLSINLRKRNTDSTYNGLQKLLERNKQGVLNARINAMMGRYYNYIGALDSSKINLQKAINRISLEKDSTNLMRLSNYYFVLGNCNKDIGLYDESLKNYLIGIQIAEKINDVELILAHKSGMGNVYNLKGNYTKAITLFKYCINNAMDSEGIYGNMINLGESYTHLKKYDNAIKTYEKALSLIPKEKNYYAKVVLNIDLGITHYEIGYFDKALSYYKKAKKIALQHKMQLQYLTAIYNEARVYCKLKNYVSAKTILFKALKKAQSLKNIKFEKEIYRELKDIATEQKKWENAYSWQQRYYQLNDSIKNIQKAKEIKELEIKYEATEKAKEIAILRLNYNKKQLEAKNKEATLARLTAERKLKDKEKENQILQLTNASEKKQNQILKLKETEFLKDNEIKKQKSIKRIVLVSFIVVLIPAITLLLVYYQKLKTQNELNRKKEEINQQKIASLIKEQKLKLAKASINGQYMERKRIAQELHDQIGGNLSAIKLQFSTFKNTNEMYQKVTQQIDDTYDLVRNLSHNMIPKKFIDYPFTNLIEEYICNINSENQQINFDPYPKKEINKINEKVQIEIYTIIQELLTNALKHAKANKIDIHLHLLDNLVKIIFEDNGIGFNTKRKNLGIGLQNIKSRLDILKGTVYIDSKINRGTIVDIDIPLHS